MGAGYTPGRRSSLRCTWANLARIRISGHMQGNKAFRCALDDRKYPRKYAILTSFVRRNTPTRCPVTKNAASAQRCDGGHSVDEARQSASPPSPLSPASSAGAARRRHSAACRPASPRRPGQRSARSDSMRSVLVRAMQCKHISFIAHISRKYIRKYGISRGNIPVDICPLSARNSDPSQATGGH